MIISQAPIFNRLFKIFQELKKGKMITKIVLSLITIFLFILSVYLIITAKKIEGTYYNGRSGWGWIHNSFNGYLLLVIAIVFLLALIFISKGKKIKL